MASIRDVAREAGVSPATVSRTFTTPGLINEDTQKRVLAAARDLGYQPPRLRTPRSSRIAPSLLFNKALVPGQDAIGFQFFAALPGDSLLNNVFYAPVLAGAQAEASALGLHVLIHSTDRDTIRDSGSDSRSLPRMVREKAVGGLLLVGTVDPQILSLFACHLKAIVLVDNYEPVGPFESVVSDGFNGAYRAAHHLIELGHRRIGFYLAEPEVATFQDRLRGYVAALFEAGITPDPTLVARGDESTRVAELGALLNRSDRPTALMAANDHYALVALRLCREQGLRVPDDLSLVGFDDVTLSAATDPPLTTVRVDTQRMGRLAVRRLLAEMHAGSSIQEHLAPHLDERQELPEAGVRHEIPVTLIVRASTAPPFSRL